MTTSQELILQLTLLKEKLQKNEAYFQAWSKNQTSYEPVAESWRDAIDQWEMIKASMEVFIKENS